MVKEKNNYPRTFTANVLIYNDEQMNYRKAVPINIDITPHYYECDAYGIAHPESVVYGQTIVMETGVYEEHENIELDPTTMKRIAVYNKTQECIRLDKQIKEKQEKIRELDALLQDKGKRWKKVQDYIKQIYNISVDEEDEYDDYD